MATTNLVFNQGAHMVCIKASLMELGDELAAAVTAALPVVATFLASSFTLPASFATSV